MNCTLVESQVNVGDLVFINHLTKPIKTGWWRKLLYNGEVQYYLEKPMHTGFTISDDSLSYSRTEKNVFVMKPTTLTETPWKDNYEMMYIVRGATTVNLMKNGYVPKMKFLKSNSFLYSDRGEALMKIWGRVKLTDIEELGSNLIGEVK